MNELDLKKYQLDPSDESWDHLIAFHLPMNSTPYNSLHIRDIQRKCQDQLKALVFYPRI